LINIRAQDVDQARRGISFIIFHQPDFRPETFRTFNELGRGPGVQSLFVGDLQVTPDRYGLSFVPPTHA
jgi:hypothetical protein